MRDREVYPNAPLVFVALELRHPAEPLSTATQAKMKRLVAPWLPILRTVTFTTTQVTVNAKNDVTTQLEIAPKYLNREQTTSVTFLKEAVVVETTEYECYESLRKVIELAMRAREEIEPVSGIERVGLRYINEIRVPENGSDPVGWLPWVEPSLLGPAPLGKAMGLDASQLQGVVMFGNNSEDSLILRYGPRFGYAVDPMGDLKRLTPVPGPFFLLDIDSFWAPDGPVPQFDRHELLRICDRLHEPVRTIFDGLISERLRTEVLRDGR